MNMFSLQQSACRSGLSPESLAVENYIYKGCGGISQENRESGFVPAFLDRRSGRILRSRYPDGQPAPIHMIGGVPDALVSERDALGRVTCLKADVIAGFLKGDLFYTREQAAKALRLREAGATGSH